MDKISILRNAWDKFIPRWLYIASNFPLLGKSRSFPVLIILFSVALKTEEVEGEVKTYMTVFSVDGQNTLMSETLIGNKKFEGIEFL